MRLADHIIEAVGSEADEQFVGAFSNLAHEIKQAEIFELTDDVALASYHLTRSKPSALLAAMPMCRAPYSKIWLEWRGGLLGHNARYEPHVETPSPVKQGCLIETNPTGHVGFMTFAWIHKEREGGPTNLLNIAPLGVMFDWTRQVNFTELLQQHLLRLSSDRDIHRAGYAVEKMLFDRYGREREMNDEVARKVLTRMTFKGWDKLVDNDKEREALRELSKGGTVAVTPFARAYIHAAAEACETPEQIQRFKTIVLPAWETDIEGEASMIEAVIAMMNSRNAVEHRPVNLEKLNKARAKHRRSQFLQYKTTHLKLSQAQTRAFRAGLLSREDAGWHRVRGHFKIRKTGIYWWSPFFRGDPARNAMRDSYVVEQPA